MDEPTGDDPAPPSGPLQFPGSFPIADPAEEPARALLLVLADDLELDGVEDIARVKQRRAPS